MFSLHQAVTFLTAIAVTCDALLPESSSFVARPQSSRTNSASPYPIYRTAGVTSNIYRRNNKRRLPLLRLSNLFDDDSTDNANQNGGRRNRGDPEPESKESSNNEESELVSPVSPESGNDGQALANEFYKQLRQRSISKDDEPQKSGSSPDNDNDEEEVYGLISPPTSR